MLLEFPHLKKFKQALFEQNEKILTNLRYNRYNFIVCTIGLTLF